MQVKDRSSSVIAIRAAVLREPGGPLRIEKLEMEGPREDEVLVRLVARGICQADIDLCDSGAGGPAWPAFLVQLPVLEMQALIRKIKNGRCRKTSSGLPTAERDGALGFLNIQDSNWFNRPQVRVIPKRHGRAFAAESRFQGVGWGTDGGFWPTGSRTLKRVSPGRDSNSISPP